MNSRTLLNIGIATVTLVLGVVLYFASRIERGDPRVHFALVPEALEKISRIEIERRGQNAIVLERNDGQWRMSAPRAARLDEVQLGRVLDVARFKAGERMNADELARFELDKPWARIRFDRHAVEFGATNGLTQELYLKSGDHVYAVPSRLAAGVPGNAARLLAHRVFGPDEHPVAFALPDFTLRHDGVRWLLQPPDPALSQDDLIRWVDQWRLASSVTTQPAERTQPADSIRIEIKGARTVVLDVLQRAPNLVLLRRDELLQYHLPASYSTTLLAAPNAAPAQKH